MKKTDHHYSILVTVFVLVVLAAGIIFMTQFNAQVGEAGRMIKTNVQTTVVPSDAIGGDVRRPTIGSSAWEEARKKGIQVDPGYNLTDFEDFDNIIIINNDEEKPKLVLYDPRWQEAINEMLKSKPYQPPKPVPPTLEELGRIKRSGSWTCYYDENGNFVRAWRTSRNGHNVEINEDPDGSHKCPKTTEVKTPAPSLPPPIVGESDGTVTKN